MLFQKKSKAIEAVQFNSFGDHPKVVMIKYPHHPDVERFFVLSDNDHEDQEVKPGDYIVQETAKSHPEVWTQHNFLQSYEPISKPKEKT